MLNTSELKLRMELYTVTREGRDSCVKLSTRSVLLEEKSASIALLVLVVMNYCNTEVLMMNSGCSHSGTVRPIRTQGALLKGV